jgi:hypothetical protein
MEAQHCNDIGRSSKERLRELRKHLQSTFCGAVILALASKIRKLRRAVRKTCSPTAQIGFLIACLVFLIPFFKKEDK